jgi:hypothetical protein
MNNKKKSRNNLNNENQSIIIPPGIWRFLLVIVFLLISSGIVTGIIFNNIVSVDQQKAEIPYFFGMANAIFIALCNMLITRGIFLASKILQWYGVFAILVASTDLIHISSWQISHTIITTVPIIFSAIAIGLLRSTEYKVLILYFNERRQKLKEMEGRR